MRQNASANTLEDLLRFIEQAKLSGTRKRDMVSAVKRICEMAGATPAGVPLEAPLLRGLLSKIRPAAHGISAKSYSNLRSLLTAALELAGAFDRLGRGEARRQPAWGPLLQAMGDDKRLTNGIAAFANWCTLQNISPQAVGDAAVERFLTWLEGRTLYPKPRDLVRRVPNVWNEASAKVPSWPEAKLTPLSFKIPSKHLKWEDLSASFQQDAEAYLTLRANPDLFDDRPYAPRRPLAATTLRQQREHLRLAASILAENEFTEVTSLEELVQPQSFKAIPTALPQPSERRAECLRKCAGHNSNSGCPISSRRDYRSSPAQEIRGQASTCPF